MSDRSNTDKELNQLLSGFLEGDLEDEQKLRLAQIIQESPDARQAYLDHCRMHAALAAEHGVLDSLGFPEQEMSNVVAPSFGRAAIRYAAIAACITLVLGVIWNSAAPDLRARAWTKGKVLAQVERKAGGVLGVERTNLKLQGGDDLRAGEYRLTEGVVNIRFPKGVDVVVEAPALFRIESSELMTLHEGKLSATVAIEGRGFTVRTPNTEVIDHGTEFGVSVGGEGTSEVHVFQGEVEVRPFSEPDASLRLLTDQATRIGGDAGSPTGITIEPEQFLRSLDEPSPSYSHRIHQLKPVVYFRMRPSEDGVTLNDHSRNKLHATLVQGRLEGAPFAKGKLGSSFYQEGNDSRNYAHVPDYPKAENNQLSVMAWVKAESRPRWASIAKNWAEGYIGQFHFGLRDYEGGLEVRIKHQKGGGAGVLEPVPFPIGSWQHVAFVADGKMLRLYRNGKEVGSVKHKALAKPNFKALGIGTKLIGNHRNRPGTPVDFWDGRIDELAVFNHVIDAETIRELYELERVEIETARR